MSMYFGDSETASIGEGLLNLGLVNEKGTLVYEGYFKSIVPISKEATAVHGLTAEMLADKPYFSDEAPKIIEMIKGQTLVFHNAKFDARIINKDLQNAGFPTLEELGVNVIDTLPMAQEVFGHGNANLDVLMTHYGVEGSRELHGAAEDSRILALIYPFLERDYSTAMRIKAAYEDGLTTQTMDELTKASTEIAQKMKELEAQRDTINKEIKSRLSVDGVNKNHEDAYSTITWSTRKTLDWKGYITETNPLITDETVRNAGFESESAPSMTIRTKTEKARKAFLEKKAA